MTAAGDEPQATRDYAIRPYRPDDLEGVLAVIQAAFARWPLPELDVPPIDHLRWKLESHPETPGHSWVVEREGRIIAADLGLAGEGKLHDRTLLVNYGAESAMLPEFQGQGIFSALRAEILPLRRRHLDVHLGGATNPAVLHIRRQQGETHLMATPIEHLVLPVRLLRTLRREGPRTAPRTLVCIVASLAARARPRHRSGARLRLEETLDIDERFDALWGEASPQFAFAGSRSSARLRWRFGDPRGGRFTILTALDGDRLAGYAVFRASRGRGYLADLLVSPNQIDALAQLLDAAVAGLRAMGVDDVSCALPQGHPYAPALRARGFVRFSETRLGVRPLRLAPEELAFLWEGEAPIHLTLADLDGTAV